MILHRRAREFYSLAIATEPAVAGWEASFDGGATWATGAAVTGGWRWLVAGPQAPLDEPASVIDRSVVPLVRAVDTPEILVRAAPTIYLV